MDDQYHMLPEPTPPESLPDLPHAPPAVETPAPERATLSSHPPGVLPEDPSGTVLLVPSERVVSSRYRAMLPYAPDSHEVQRALAVIKREGYPALPARWIDARYEVFGHELLLDALHASGAGVIRIRPVVPASEEEAYVRGRCERDRHTPRPSHYELMREVWTVCLLEGCSTWAQVGETLGYTRSTIAHAQRDGSRITPAVVERAGIDESDPEQIEQLRRASGKRLRWVGKGRTHDDRAIRLALVVRGEAPDWATAEQIEANQEEDDRDPVRVRRGRDGKTVAVAELTVTGASKEELKGWLNRYGRLMWRAFEEANPVEEDPSHTD